MQNLNSDMTFRGRELLTSSHMIANLLNNFRATLIILLPWTLQQELLQKIFNLSNIFLHFLNSHAMNRHLELSTLEGDTKWASEGIDTVMNIWTELLIDSEADIYNVQGMWFE